MPSFTPEAIKYTYSADHEPIGTVAGVQQPVVVNDRLRNVPAEGVFNWDPGAQFGIYKPDSFWFDTVRTSGGPAATASASGPSASGPSE